MPINPLSVLVMSPRKSGLLDVPRTLMSSVSGNAANGEIISTESCWESLMWNDKSMGLETEIFASVFSLLRKLAMALLNIDKILSSELGVMSISKSFLYTNLSMINSPLTLLFLICPSCVCGILNVMSLLAKSLAVP